MQWLIRAFSEEFIFAFGILEDSERWNSKNLHDEVQLFHFTLAWEDWDASVELDEDAAETPHVNSCRVRDPNDDLWRSVESRLNVGVDPLVREARRAEVDDLDS